MNFNKPTQQDFDYVVENAYEGAVKNYPYQRVPDDNCYAIEFGGLLVGVGGMVLHWEGMAEFWLILTEQCRKNDIYGILALSAIKEKVEYLIKTNNIKRAQATVRTNFPEAVKMIEYLGFKNEGVMEHYCPDGHDVFRFAKVIK
jgi:RimJ/RimL family protein N-acetyltransferase